MKSIATLMIAVSLVSWNVSADPVAGASEAPDPSYSYSSFSHAATFTTHLYPDLSIRFDRGYVQFGTNSFYDLERCEEADAACINFGDFLLFDPYYYAEGQFTIEGRTFVVHNSEILLLGNRLLGKRVHFREPDEEETLNFFWTCRLGIVLVSAVGDSYPLSRPFVLSSKVGIFSRTRGCDDVD